MHARAREPLGLPLPTPVRAACSHIDVGANICQSAAQINVKILKKTESRKLSFIPPGLPRFSFELSERRRQSLACLQTQTAALTSSPRSASDYLVCSSLLWDGNRFCKTPKTLKRPDPLPEAATSAITGAPTRAMRITAWDVAVKRGDNGPQGS